MMTINVLELGRSLTVRKPRTSGLLSSNRGVLRSLFKAASRRAHNFNMKDMLTVISIERSVSHMTRGEQM